jgi:hypothetical protein
MLLTFHTSPLGPPQEQLQAKRQLTAALDAARDPDAPLQSKKTLLRDLGDRKRQEEERVRRMQEDGGAAGPRLVVPRHLGREGPGEAGGLKTEQVVGGVRRGRALPGGRVEVEPVRHQG